MGLDIYPIAATEGGVVTISYSGIAPIDFRNIATVFLSPDVLPVSMPTAGASGPVAFGYPIGFQVQDATKLNFTVPTLSADPLQGLAPGGYAVIATFPAAGYLTLARFEVLRKGQPVPAPAGAWFAAGNVPPPIHASPYNPGIDVPYPWTFWWDSVASRWHSALMPLPPRGWHVAFDPYHGWVILPTPGWGPPPPASPPAGWPPWQPQPAPPAPQPPGVVTLPPPMGGSPRPANWAPVGAAPPSSAAAARAYNTMSGAAGGSASPTFPAGGAGSSEPESEPEVEGEPGQLHVQWLVESFTPLRAAPGATLYQNPLYASPIPIPNPSAPPIRRLGAILSARLLDENDLPVVGKQMTFAFLKASDVPSDTDSLMCEVSNNFDYLDAKLNYDLPGSGIDFAETDDEGKTYCWFDLHLVDDAEITDPLLNLKGFRVIIGDPRPVSAVSTVATGGPGGAGGGGGGGGGAVGGTDDRSLLDKLEDILVEPFQEAVISYVVRNPDQVLQAVAGIKRRTDETLGFMLNRWADGFIISQSGGRVVSISDEQRAPVIGGLLGIAHGIWAFGGDTINSVRVLFDLPRAIADFFAENAKLKLEVVGSILDYRTGVVLYMNDQEFSDRIDYAFKRVASSAPQVWVFIRDGVAPVLKGMLQAFARAVAKAIATGSPIPQLIFAFSEAVGNLAYDRFPEFVGSIATDSLGYKKDSALYHYFSGGFFWGDWIGWLVATVGFQIVLGYLTAGIGTVISAVGKIAVVQEAIAWLAGGAAKGLEILVKLIDLLKTALAAAGQLLAQLKDAIGRVILAIVKFFTELLQPLVEPVLAAFGGAPGESMRTLLQYAGLEGEQIVGIAQGLTDSATDGQVARDVIRCIVAAAQNPAGALLLECV